MDLNALISTYGYLFVMLGVFLEGEAVVLTAGFLAYTGVLSLEGVMLSAFAGSVLTYHTLFWVGRFKGREVLMRKGRLAQGVAKVSALLHRHRIGTVLGYRLCYGVRSAIPLMLGTTSLTYRQFAVLDLLPALAWAFGVPTAGFLLSRFGESAAAHIHQPLYWLAALAFACSMFLLLVLRARRRKGTA